MANNGIDWLVVLGWSVVFTILFSAIFWTMKTQGEDFSYSSYFRYLKSRFISIWLGNLMLFACVFLLPWYLLMIAFFLLPFLLTNAATSGLDDGARRFKKGFKISAKIYGTSLLNLLLLTLLTIVLSQLIASVFSIHNDYTNKPMMNDLLDMLAGFVKRIAMVFTDDYMFYANITRQIIYGLFILLILPLLVISTGFMYYNVIERLEAKGLRKEFEKFGKRKRNQESNSD